jgi:hypothetical protein
MKYVTTIERMAEERGGEKARTEESRSLALKMLQEGATLDFVTKVTGFSAVQIQDIQAEAE